MVHNTVESGHMTLLNSTIGMSSMSSMGEQGDEQPLATSSKMSSLEGMIDQNLLRIEVLTMALVFVLALVGNSIVVGTLLLRRYFTKRAAQNRVNKLSRMNFFIFHLSLADIYVSLGNILTMLLWRQNNNLFYGGDLLCRVVVYVQLVSVYYSTYVLITMSIDRFEAICRPFIGLSWSKQRGLVYIAAAFVCAHLQGIPQIMFFALRNIPNVEPPIQTCYAQFEPQWFQSAYIVYTCVMQFLMPLCIIVACYTSISMRVANSLKGKSKSKKSIAATGVYSKSNSHTNSKPSSSAAAAAAVLVAADVDLLDNDRHQHEMIRLTCIEPVAAAIGVVDSDHRSPPTTTTATTTNDKNKNKKKQKQMQKQKQTKQKTVRIAKRSSDSSTMSDVAATIDMPSFYTHDSIGGSGGAPSVSVSASYATRPYGKASAVSFRQHCSKNFSKSKMKTIKLTLTVIVLYIICSTPYYIGMVMNVMLKPEYFQQFAALKYFTVLSCLLSQLNSCVNPWIYLSFNSKFGNCFIRKDKSTTHKSVTSDTQISSTHKVLSTTMA